MKTKNVLFLIVGAIICMATSCYKMVVVKNNISEDIYVHPILYLNGDLHTFNFSPVLIKTGESEQVAFDDWRKNSNLTVKVILYGLDSLKRDTLFKAEIFPRTLKVDTIVIDDVFMKKWTYKLESDS